MPKTKNPQVAALEAVATKLGKAKPDKAYALLHGAFLVYAAAGDAAHADAIVQRIYDGALPKPTKLIHVFGTGPIDGFAFAAKLPDRTGGEPRAHHVPPGTPLAERVRMTEGLVRHRLTGDAYGQFPPPKQEWTELEGRELWRKAQILARPTTDDGAPSATEADALAALTKYVDRWCDAPAERGAGYGQELVLAIDVALRHGARAAVDRWVAALGSKLLEHVEDALCLPAIAAAIHDGLLKRVVGLDAREAEALFESIDAAAVALARTPPKAEPAGKPTVRRVSAQYSQFSIGHATAPPGEVFFQDPRENAQGMSIFPTQVGIATPAETSECIVELAVASKRPSKNGPSAVQSVAFPFTVRGPLFVRSAIGGGDDEDREVILPHGTYDVLVRFFIAQAAKEDAAVGLRAFRVALDFLPLGTVAAPKCFTLEEGKPPKTIFVR